MAENTKKIATVGYDSIHKQDLQNLCKSLGMNQGEFIEHAVDFFKRTGIDPREKSGGLTEKTDVTPFYQILQINSLGAHHPTKQ